ncbi:permease [Fulvitalea axinellae]|uniref:Permease n=1 Tax=Fulvitalea axinellae TaxID=1182444 RepID=A0AAU9CHE7_9BACT|nr:permease [Fulvitalea axinellae]
MNRTATVKQPVQTPLATEKQSALLPWMILLGLSLIWGSSFILMKRGLEVFSPIEVGALRVSLAGITLLPVALYHFRKFPRKKFFDLFLCGLTNGLLPCVFFPLAQSHTESAVVAIVNALTPLSVILIGYLAFRAKVSRQQAIGVAIGFAGSVVLVTAGATEDSAGFNAYLGFVVLSTLSYGYNINHVKFRLSDMKPLTITAFGLGLMLPVTLSYLFYFSDFVQKMQSGPQAWEALGYLAILGMAGTAMALVIFNKLIQLAGPVFSGAVTYIVPFIAVIWGLFDGETLFLGHFVGMAIVITGLLIANMRRNR